MGSYLHVSTGCANKPTSAQASHRVTSLSPRHPPAPKGVILNMLQGHSWFSMVCTTDYRGMSAVMPGAPLSPLFLTELGVCRAVSLTYPHSSLPHTVGLQYFSPSQIYFPRGSATVADGLRCGQWHWLHWM